MGRLSVRVAAMRYQELSEKTKKEIQKALEEIRSGRYLTQEDLEREMGF